MIEARSLNGLAFPWILIEDSGKVIASRDGALFAAPPYSLDPIAQQAMRINVSGWAICPNGYALYKFTSDLIAPSFILLHGLKVSGISTAQGRSDALSIRTSTDEVVRYVQSFMTALEALDDDYRALIRQNIHEVRGINSALYNTAFGLQASLEQFQHQTASVAQSVVRLSELLRARIDFMEFIANPSAQEVAKGEIAVYRKFDKLMRCFKGTAYQRRISFDLHGSSNKTVYGPAIFDLVPYLLLDNAIKYAPDSSVITIICNDSERAVFCSVSSLGPRIAEDEVDTIFLPNVRGRFARRSGVSGSGLGLAALRKIVVDIFGGSIKVIQPSADAVSINGVPYCDVTFDLKFPTYGSA